MSLFVNFDVVPIDLRFTRARARVPKRPDTRWCALKKSGPATAGPGTTKYDLSRRLRSTTSRVPPKGCGGDTVKSRRPAGHIILASTAE